MMKEEFGTSPKSVEETVINEPEIYHGSHKDNVTSLFKQWPRPEDIVPLDMLR